MDGWMDSLQFPAQPSWVHDIKWSHAEAGMVAAASFDEVSVYSVHGMSSYVHDASEDGFAGSEVVRGQTPPSWLRRPCGAQIGFGGRLVSFSGRHVHLTPCINDEEFAKSAKALDSCLQEKTYVQFAGSMESSSESEDDKETWKVMEALFTDATRKVILDHFKFNKTEIQQQWAELDFAEMSDDKVSESYVGGDLVERLLSRAVMVGDFKTAVDGCLRSNRLSDALILAVLGGEDLWKETRQHVLDRRMDNLLGRVTSTAVSRDLHKFVDESSIEHWQDSLAMICTYATDDFADLARTLGNRIVESNPHAAKLCFMIAGDLHRSFAMWFAEATDGSDSMEALTPAAAVRSGGGTLQNIVAKICVFLRATGQDKLVEENGENVKTLQNMADILTNYALILCSQGLIEEALFCLDVLNLPSHERSVSLRERIHHMLGDHHHIVEETRMYVPKDEIVEQESELLPNATHGEDSTMSEAPLETEHYDGQLRPGFSDGGATAAGTPVPIDPVSSIPPPTQEYTHPGYSQPAVSTPMTYAAPTMPVPQPGTRHHPVAGTAMSVAPVHTTDMSMGSGDAPAPESEGYGASGGYYGSGAGGSQPTTHQQHSSMISPPFTTTTIEPSAEKSSASMEPVPSDPTQVDISSGPDGITYVRDVLINTMNACYSDPSFKRKRGKVSQGISALLTFVVNGRLPVDVALELAKDILFSSPLLSSHRIPSHPIASIKSSLPFHFWSGNVHLLNAALMSFLFSLHRSTRNCGTIF
jgi:protein transport protein SEC31